MLNLGDVNFGVGADTKGLERSLNKLREFAREVDRVTSVQQKGAKEAVRAYAAQERAVKSALQQVLNMNQQLKKAGVPPEQLARTTNAFRALTNAMTSGRLSVVEYNRVQDKFKSTMGNVARSLRDFKTSEPAKQVSKFNEILKDLESSAVLAVGPLSGLGARIRALGAITSRSSLAIAGFLGAMTATIVGMSKLSTTAVNARMSMDKIESGLYAATGSAVLAAEEFNYVRDTAKSLGLDLAVTAGSYSKLVAASKGTELQGQKTRDIFHGIATAAKALNLDSYETEGALKAVEQMMSKGTVQAEELRGQLGDRLPGAFNLMARALGVSTIKLGEMMKEGQVLSSDALPKLAKVLEDTFGDAAARNAGKLGTSLQNLKTATFEFSLAFDDATGVTKKFQNVVNGVTRFIDYLSEHMSDLVGIVGAVSGAFLALYGPTMVMGLIRVIGLIGTFTAGVLGLNIALLSNPLVALPALLLRIGVAAVAATAGFYVFKNAASTVIDANEDIIDANNQYLESLDDTGKGIKMYTQTFIDRTKARITASKVELEALLQQQKAMEDFYKKASGTGGGLMGVASRSISALTVAGAGLMGHTYEGQLEKVDKLKANIKNMEDQLKSLDGVAEQTNVTPPDVGSGTKEFKKAAEKVKDLTFEIEQLQRVQAAIASGGSLESVKQVQNAAEAAKMLADVPKEELFKISEALKAAGFEGKTVEEALAKAIGKQNELNLSINGFEDSLDKIGPAIEEYNTKLQELRNKAVALSSGTKAFEKFNEEVDRAKQIDDVVKSMKEAGISQADINAKVTEFGAALDNVTRAQKEFDKLKEIQDDIEGAFKKGFDTFGDGMLEVVNGTKSVADAFSDMATSIINDIARIVIQQSIVKPLADSLTGGSSGGGGFLSNLASSLVGGLFGGGSPGRMIYSSPIGPGLTGRATGGLGVSGLTLVGEQGPELLQIQKSANIFPANATSRLLGGGMGGTEVNVIINNNSANTKATVRESDSGGVRNIEVMIDEITAKNITNASSRSNKAVRALTGQKTTVGR